MRFCGLQVKYHVIPEENAVKRYLGEVFLGFLRLQVKWHVIPGKSGVNHRFGEAFVSFLKSQLKLHAFPGALPGFFRVFVVYGRSGILELFPRFSEFFHLLVKKVE